MSPNDLLVEMAMKFVGVKEEGDNKGHWVEIFQRSLGNPAVGQAWCCDFLQYLLGQVDQQLKAEIPSWPGHVINKTQSAMQMWNMTRQSARRAKPDRGLIAVWQHWKIGLDPKGRRFELALPTGHCGVVVNPIGVDVFESVEGNTGPGTPGVDRTVVREGDGVYLKRRTTESDVGTMRFKGFLDPFSP